jgi:3-dehydroquinate synthase
MKKELISKVDYLQIKNTINHIFDIISFTESDLNEIVELLLHDKKNEYGRVNFVLIDSIGKIKINQEVENESIIEAFQDYKS